MNSFYVFIKMCLIHWLRHPKHFKTNLYSLQIAHLYAPNLDLYYELTLGVATATLMSI